ncbi:MAG: hypothetical protein DRR06_18150 [Gammaproteobacteria bacterium]|nr:MAG: hypothetical protein DRR06_18150 [Gammaproteobacteria bacterium]
MFSDYNVAMKWGRHSAKLLIAILYSCAGAGAAEDDGYQAGYDDIPVFGGPDGVSEDLRSADEIKATRFKFDPENHLLAPYFDAKRELEDDHGVAFGVRYYLLAQHASASAGDKTAAGGVFRFQGTWTLFEGKGKNRGFLEWRLENRHALWGRQAPSELAANIGAAALNTGFAYTPDFDTDLAVFNWTQLFNQGRSGIAAGRLAFPSYLDSMPFQTFTRGFINRSFFINPTLGTSGIGALGMVAKGFVSEQFWLGAHIYDGNAVNGSFDLDTFREKEWLTAVEVGWTPQYEHRRNKLLQFTYWHKDGRSLAGVPAGSGWAASGVWQLSDTVLPFVRLGHSDGGAGVQAESAISAGVELTNKFNDALSVGVGWAQPSEKTHGQGAGDEWVLETSYKFQLSDNFSITPDVQLLLNPAKNPDKSRVWIMGLRMLFFY